MDILSRTPSPLRLKLKTRIVLLSVISTTRPRLEHIEIADGMRAEESALFKPIQNFPSECMSCRSTKSNQVAIRNPLSTTTHLAVTHHPSLHSFSTIDSIDSRLRQLLILRKNNQSKLPFLLLSFARPRTTTTTTSTQLYKQITNSPSSSCAATPLEMYFDCVSSEDVFLR